MRPMHDRAMAGERERKLINNYDTGSISSIQKKIKYTISNQNHRLLIENSLSSSASSRVFDDRQLCIPPKSN